MFCFINPASAAGTVSFTADTIVSLTGIADGDLYAADTSQAGSISVNGSALTISAIPDGDSFILKTADHDNALKLTPSGGTVDLDFDSSHLSSGEIIEWALTATGSTQVVQIVGVPLASTWYKIKVGGVDYNSYQSSSSSEVSFMYSGSWTASDIFTIEETTAPSSDSTSPVLSNGAPDDQTFSVTTTSATLSLTTNETATCKYSTTADTAYASMTSEFDDTNSTSHSTLVTGLSSGNSYTYYVRCQDDSSNPTTSDYALTFSVAPVEQNTGTLNTVKIKLSRITNKFKDTIHLAASKFKIKQTDSSLANGTVKIYKGNKLWKTVVAGANGAWSKTLKLANNTNKTIKLYFYDSWGSLLGTKKAKIAVDTEDPKFTKFITLLSGIKRGDMLYWEAKDNEKVESYKVYFNGHIDTKEQSKFTVPQDISAGIYGITVKAYDKAGNSASKKTFIRVK